MSLKCVSAGCGHLDEHCVGYHFVFYCGFQDIDQSIDYHQILQERQNENEQISNFLANLQSVLKQDKTILDIAVIDHSSPLKFVSSLDQRNLSENELRSIGDVYAESIGHRHVGHWHIIVQRYIFEEDENGDLRSDGKLFNEINGKIEQEINKASIKQLKFRSLK